MAKRFQLASFLKGFRTALGFLTILPVPAAREVNQNVLAGALPWFPWVGLVAGAAAAAAALLLSRVFSPLTTAVLSVAVWALITGGLHLDGLADCCDGLLVSAPSERRLEIMKDPRLGGFGAIGLFLFLLLKVAALQTVIESSAWTVILLSAAAGRSAVYLALSQPSARPGGLGAQLGGGTSWAGILFGLIPLVGLVVWLGWPGLGAVAAGGLMCGGALWMARNRIGGVTGDVHGLVIELVEMVVLLVYPLLSV